MLVDLEEFVARAISKPIVNSKSVVEVELSQPLRRELSLILPGVHAVGPFSTTLEIEGGNFAMFPNQYYRFAVAVRDLALVVRSYFEVMDMFRAGLGHVLDGTAAEIVDKLATTKLPVALNPQDAELFAKFMGKDDDKWRLGGKRPVNKDGSLRTSADCFGSVILTQINVPNASSAVLGTIVYALANQETLYQRLVDFYAASDDATEPPTGSIPAPKPFLLLAGISGTGKSRFVREQAQRQGALADYYELVPVRPDWHEPSDLLGYVSRINGEQFVTTRLLAFMIRAWLDAIDHFAEDGKPILKNLDKIRTFWVCLDEMNLAPVEQYLADFLAVVETRRWDGNAYDCDPILKIQHLPAAVYPALQRDLKLEEHPDFWAYVRSNGIALPPNLMIAGTVNMDETTHGFSRKVIDRAFTLDFGEFFPNDFAAYFVPKASPVTFTFPRWSHVTRSELAAVEADPDGQRSIAFLEGVNEKLRGTAFQLAFRALNELLVAVRSFAPATNAVLAAVWDDFLMAKLLPRLEGDAEKLDNIGTGDSLLVTLAKHVRAELEKLLAPSEPAATGSPTSTLRRPDLFRQSAEPIDIEPRSLKALARMQARLEKHNFTSFWP